MKPSSTQSGIAGEYLVAGELARRGYIASITLRNTRGIDTLASSVDAARSVGLQVKTNQGDHRRWLVGAKAETRFGDSLLYAFVNLHDLGQPTFHIVPSQVVADYVRNSTTSMRTFEDKEERYLDRWDLLGLGNEEA